jgi:NADPH2:quinone reductase
LFIDRDGFACGFSIGEHTMVQAIQLDRFGDPSVLIWRSVAVGRPGAGYVRVRHKAVGLNFIDIVQRRGSSPIPLTLPGGLGGEAAGIVEEVGRGVSEFSVGDRVAYANVYGGAYAEARLINANSLIKLPDRIGDRQAAAIMLKGMTARCLVKQVAHIEAGDIVLFHAAAGGVGLIACQWLKHLGATVIGTVSNEDKASLARANGCDHVIVYGRDNFARRVVEITNGDKVHVVFDSVGKETFAQSLECLRPRGLAILFGQASGPVAPLDLGVLASKGALFVTRPTLTAYVATRGELLANAEDLFEVVATGVVKVSINQTYQLRNAEQAHRDMESRQTTGSSVLLV